MLGRMGVREEMKMATAVKEVITRKENETKTTGEGMCFVDFQYIKRNCICMTEHKINSMFCFVIQNTRHQCI